ncbi:hypothetical protein C8F04DRAFT_1254261 [Mycena alexandri]|uniref:Uncharacterized protein n=1 Tax=Mycena alexandri TaxID=1745969 RepID=A0AAD6T5F3_9AGAR|nr:hypothetical protein C8F04DRAFT_1254261 [Mycena alexandri]
MATACQVFRTGVAAPHTTMGSHAQRMMARCDQCPLRAEPAQIRRLTLHCPTTDNPSAGVHVEIKQANATVEEDSVVADATKPKPRRRAKKEPKTEDPKPSNRASRSVPVNDEVDAAEAPAPRRGRSCQDATAVATEGAAHPVPRPRKQAAATDTTDTDMDGTLLDSASTDLFRLYRRIRGRSPTRRALVVPKAELVPDNVVGTTIDLTRQDAPSPRPRSAAPRLRTAFVDQTNRSSQVRSLAAPQHFPASPAPASSPDSPASPAPASSPASPASPAPASSPASPAPASSPVSAAPASSPASAASPAPAPSPAAPPRRERFDKGPLNPNNPHDQFLIKQLAVKAMAAPRHEPSPPASPSHSDSDSRSRRGSNSDDREDFEMDLDAVQSEEEENEEVPKKPKGQGKAASKKPKPPAPAAKPRAPTATAKSKASAVAGNSKASHSRSGRGSNSDDGEDFEADLDTVQSEEDVLPKKAKGKGKAAPKQPKAAPKQPKAAAAKPKKAAAAAAKPKATAKSKGKQKARVVDAYDEFLDKITSLADETGYSGPTLHQTLGTAIKKPRAPTSWNVYEQFYAQEHTQSGSTEAFNVAACRQDYLALCAKLEIEPSDSKAVFAAEPWLLEWREKLTQNTVIQLRNKNQLKAKVQAEVKPIIAIAKLIYNTLGVHIHGRVIDTNGDASFMFGVGPIYKEMRRLNESSINQTIKDEEHIPWSSEIERRRRGLPAAHVPAPAKSDERLRDTYRRQFGQVLAPQLHSFLHPEWTQQPLSKYKMPWAENFLDAVWKAGCRLVNYPTALADKNLIVGKSSFTLKKIPLLVFKEFMPDVLDVLKAESQDSSHPLQESIMRIVHWDEDESEMELEDQAELGLVSDAEGQVLLRVQDSPLYQWTLAEHGTAQEKESKPKRATKKKTLVRSHSPSRSEDPPSPLQYSRSRSPSRRRDPSRSRSPSRRRDRDYDYSRYRRRDDSRSRSPRRDRDRDYDYSRYRRRDDSRSRSPRRRADPKDQQEKEKVKVKVKPSRAAATGSRTTHERALEERIAPSLPRQAKRARSVVGEQDDRGGSKRPCQEASPETAPQENNRLLMKLWFAIRKPGDEKATTSMTFFATHLIATDQRTNIRPGMTPVLATDEDKDRYERAKDLLALHGAK